MGAEEGHPGTGEVAVQLLLDNTFVYPDHSSFHRMIVGNRRYFWLSPHRQDNTVGSLGHSSYRRKMAVQDSRSFWLSLHRRDTALLGCRIVTYNTARLQAWTA